MSPWRWRNIKIGLALAALATGATMLLTRGGDPTTQAPRPGAAACATEGVTARVTKVTDGDTIHAQLLCGPEEGVAVTVRIVGMNTPETKRPRSPVQCFGPEASAYAARQLSDRTVVLIADSRAGRLDKYGRRLFHVEVGGRDYAADAIRAGYAEHDDYGHRQDRSATYALAQVEAQLDHVGAWAACPSPFKR